MTMNRVVLLSLVFTLSLIHISGFDHVQNAFGAQALKSVRRSAGLVGAAAQHGAARGLDFLRHRHHLLFALHAAGTADDHDFFAAAHLDARYVDDAVLLVKQAVGLFVGLGHPLHVLHIGVGADQMCIRDRFSREE